MTLYGVGEYDSGFKAMERMTNLLTGAAGFIGFHVARRLLDQGERVVGVDNLNSYYSVALKEDRLGQLLAHPNFTFHQINIADRGAGQPGGSPRIGITANANIKHARQSYGVWPLGTPGHGDGYGHDPA